MVSSNTDLFDLKIWELYGFILVVFEGKLIVVLIVVLPNYESHISERTETHGHPVKLEIFACGALSIKLTNNPYGYIKNLYFVSIRPINTMIRASAFCKYRKLIQ